MTCTMVVRSMRMHLPTSCWVREPLSWMAASTPRWRPARPKGFRASSTVSRIFWAALLSRKPALSRIIWGMPEAGEVDFRGDGDFFARFMGILLKLTWTDDQLY